MANNLRVIYNNLVDLSTTTVTGSSTAAGSSISNLKLDTKSRVWRSGSTTSASSSVKAILVIDFGSQKYVGGVGLAFTNLNGSTSSITVKGYNSSPTLGGTVNAPTVTGTSVYSKTGTCCPWNTLNTADWIVTSTVNGNYSYGGGTYARLWLPEHKTTAVRYLSIEITDNYSTSAAGRYIEVSRLIVGDYWSPTYNTSFGVVSTLKDMSTSVRTESGDLITRVGPKYNTLKFDTGWLTPSDRKELSRILLGVGLAKPLFVSLFPDNGTTEAEAEQERIHQIYGKLSDLPGITYEYYQIYSTSFDIEEV